MSPVIYPLIVLVFIFILTKYLMCIEREDKVKLLDAFGTVKDDPKTINYLAYVSNQPIWRLSLIGSLLGGMIFYILSALLTNSSWTDHRIFRSTLLATIVMYLTTTATSNYTSFHNICPYNCNDKYQQKDKCTKFSLLPCNTS